MSRVERSLIIMNKLGLHARAATKLAQLSQNFSANITIVLNGKKADASSIMALMLLAGAQGKTVQVITEGEGEDAHRALDSICQLFTDKFDEAE
ncbi:MAG: HPr family phosphocarrier protein [Alteromonadaceae bacterium]|nr:HPr family phosphocarrier protein [Alteromonadaceae bacterium]